VACAHVSSSSSSQVVFCLVLSSMSRVCCCVSGVTDHFAQDEPHALAITRNIFANLNLRRGSIGSVAGSNVQQVAAMAAGSWDEPLYDTRELRGAVPPDSRTPWDVR
jgi:3-methylcrotonyl-CoA carboxylase beta subunit